MRLLHGSLAHRKHFEPPARPLAILAGEGSAAASKSALSKQAHRAAEARKKRGTVAPAAKRKSTRRKTA